MRITKKEALLRKAYLGCGRWEIPLIRKQNIDIESINLIGCHNTTLQDHKNRDKTVSFFINDERFAHVYPNPEGQYTRLKQYRQTLSPDFSVYTDMGHGDSYKV
jgi:hypothetical protein